MPAPPPATSITELLGKLNAIRASQAELAKAERETIAAIQATLGRQKEELARLEKKIASLGIPLEPTEILHEPAKGSTKK
jgi:hypothetical protein